MKRNIIYLTATIIIIFNGVKYAQDYHVVQLNGKIKIGESFGDIGKGFQIEQTKPVSFMPDDITIDDEGNFLICDKFSKKIIKYDKELNPLEEIQINDNNFGKIIQIENKDHLSSLYYKVDIEVDHQDNIYVLITKYGFFYRMLKYNDRGILDQSFNVEENLKGKTTNLFYLLNEKIFILTSPGNFFDSKYMENGSVFIFNFSGIFQGRGDYCYEDSKGNIYKQNNINKKNKLWIDQYNSINGRNSFFISDLKYNKSLYATLDDNVALRYLGIDSSNNLIFIDKNVTGIIGKIFDFNKDIVTDILVKGDEYRLLTSYHIIPHNPFILSPKGEIFIIAFSTSDQTNDWYKIRNYKDVAITFFKLKEL